jgi:transposase
MRGGDPQQAALFRDLSPERRRPQDPPLHAMRVLVAAVLTELSPPCARLYAHTDRPSIAPEQWLRTVLLQVLYTVRRERVRREHLDYHRRCRWLMGLHRDDPIWEASTCSKHRARPLKGAVAHACCDQVLAQARESDRLSEDHCMVDGPWIEAWAG